jgi:hypothetical protein
MSWQMVAGVTGIQSALNFFAYSNFICQCHCVSYTFKRLVGYLCVVTLSSILSIRHVHTPTFLIIHSQTKGKICVAVSPSRHHALGPLRHLNKAADGNGASVLPNAKRCLKR